jgi:hypothetical protein
MAAPFTRGYCPGCRETTKQRHLFFADAADGEEELWSICESCFTVFTEREDGSFVQRAATDQERAAVPPPVVWSEEERAWWRETLRQGQADLRAWFQSGCPGLTPELERALRPGALEQVRRLVELPDGDAIVPKSDAEPGAAADRPRE